MGMFINPDNLVSSANKGISPAVLIWARQIKGYGPEKKQVRINSKVERNLENPDWDGQALEWFITAGGERKWQNRKCFRCKGDQGSWRAVEQRSKQGIYTEKFDSRSAGSNLCTIIILKKKTDKNLFWVTILFYNFLSKYWYVTYLNTNLWSNIHSYSQNKYCPSVSST